MLHFFNGWRESLAWDDMAEYVSPEYSKRQVVEAGKLLKGSIIGSSPEAIDAFRIAHNWRASHIVPMRHMRMELAQKVRHLGSDALTAARLKRMISIRAKLARSPHSLYQMQDIGGCRAILSDQAAVSALLASYRDSPRHHFVREDDYVGRPKRTGYRSHHLIYRYHGRGEYASLNNNAQYIEIQLRTRAQHAWATAVEAVGMMRGEELKGGIGNAEWLRFFALMGSEIAAREGGEIVPGTPANESERRQEIIALQIGLDALATMDHYRNAVKITETSSTSPFYLIQFDHQVNSVNIQSVSRQASATSLDGAERGNSALNSVLVAVDKASDLRAAYPNYFMDVGLFVEEVKSAIGSTASRQQPLASRFFDAQWLGCWIRGRR